MGIYKDYEKDVKLETDVALLVKHFGFHLSTLVITGAHLSLHT